MSPAAKKQRRERIARVAEHRAAVQMTYWLSRDRSADGTISDHVDVWLVHPERVKHEGTCFGYWRLPGGVDDLQVVTGSGPMSAHMGTWSLEHCQREVRVVPDDDLQLIRVGEEVSPVSEASS